MSIEVDKRAAEQPMAEVRAREPHDRHWCGRVQPLEGVDGANRMIGAVTRHRHEEHNGVRRQRRDAPFEGLERGLRIVRHGKRRVEAGKIVADGTLPAPVETRYPSDDQRTAGLRIGRTRETQRLGRVGPHVDHGRGRRQRVLVEEPLFEESEKNRRAREQERTFTKDELRRRLAECDDEIDPDLGVLLGKQRAKALVVRLGVVTAGIEALDVELDGPAAAGANGGLDRIYQDVAAGKVRRLAAQDEYVLRRCSAGGYRHQQRN